MSSLVLTGAVLLILVVGIITRIFLFHRRSVNVVSHLHRGDVDRFLREIDNDIKNARNEKITYSLLVNKSAGHTYKGDFEGSLTILKSIDPARLPRLFKILHVNNTLVTLLLLERFDDSREFFEANREIFDNNHKNATVSNALRSTRAIYEYYLGDRGESKRAMEELLGEERAPVHEAGTHYFLGRIALDEGDVETAETHFKRAVELAPATYIPAAIERLRSTSLENQPGSI